MWHNPIGGRLRRELADRDRGRRPDRGRGGAAGRGRPGQRAARPVRPQCGRHRPRECLHPDQRDPRGAVRDRRVHRIAHQRSVRTADHRQFRDRHHPGGPGQADARQARDRRPDPAPGPARWRGHRGTAGRGGARRHHRDRCRRSDRRRRRGRRGHRPRRRRVTAHRRGRPDRQGPGRRGAVGQLRGRRRWRVPRHQGRRRCLRGPARGRGVEVHAGLLRVALRHRPDPAGDHLVADPRRRPDHRQPTLRQRQRVAAVPARHGRRAGADGARGARPDDLDRFRGGCGAAGSAAVSGERTPGHRRARARQCGLCGQDRHPDRERDAAGRGAFPRDGARRDRGTGAGRARRPRPAAQRQHDRDRRGASGRARLDGDGHQTVHLGHQVERDVVPAERLRRRGRERCRSLADRCARRPAGPGVRGGAPRLQHRRRRTPRAAAGVHRRARGHRPRAGSDRTGDRVAGGARGARTAGPARCARHDRLLRTAARRGEGHLRGQRPVGGGGRRVAGPRIGRVLRRRARVARRDRRTRRRRRTRRHLRARAARPEALDGEGAAVAGQHRRDDR